MGQSMIPDPCQPFRTSTAFAPAVKFNNFGQMVPASGRDEVEEDPVGNWGGGPADIM